MLKVIIVEDDPMVAQINQQYLEQLSGFSVIGTFHNGLQALSFLQETSVDLVILDVYMPELNGLELLEKMRELHINVDVIMVTAANDAQQISALLRFGVVDYLVKPFTAQRFKEALEKYLHKRQTLESASELSQTTIDQLFLGQKKLAETAMQKGLQQPTLHLIIDTLKENTSHYQSCENLAASTGLSKVTIRRYLNNLIESNMVESIIDYDTGGRPSVKYRYLTEG